jgi:tripartite ATP-independent transporter DctM subunit
MKALETIVNINRNINQWATNAGCVGLILIMLLPVVDVVSRWFFNSPVPGGVELVELLLVIIVMSSVAWCALQDGHVALTFIVDRLPLKAGNVFQGVTQVLSIITCTLLFYQNFLQAGITASHKVTTGILFIPHSPFLYLISAGYLLLTVALLQKLLVGLTVKDSPQERLWPRALLVIGISAVLVATAVGFYQFTDMSRMQFAFWVAIPLFVLILFSGMPVGFTLALIGFLGMAYLKGPDAAMQSLRAAPFNTAGNYSFSVVPLFVFMGILAFQTKISTDLYNAAYKWVGSFHGGLAISTVGACAGFAAICGESLAASLTMGTTALPEMKRFKYDPGLAAGSVAVGGTLGVLIPPSLVFILYALLADQSVGELFIAGIIPGIILTILLMGYIYIRCLITPSMGPPAPATPLREKITSTWQVWPVVVVFVLVIGGIYGGFFTPTEAGAVGAFTMFVMGIVKRRLSLAGLIEALRESMKLVAMGFTILIGANIFGYFLAVSKVPIFMASYVASLPLSPTWIMVVILLIYLLLGCLMPAIPMVILTVPIFFPSIKALGFDPIWFGVITALMFEAAVVTPPVGINVFGLAGVAKDIPMQTIFRGVMPFMLCIFLCIALLMAFPGIVTFLPRLLR